MPVCQHVGPHHERCNQPAAWICNSRSARCHQHSHTEPCCKALPREDLGLTPTSIRAVQSL